MSAQIKPGPAFESSEPKRLFGIHPYYIARIAGWNDSFEPAPDGKRFAVHSTSDSPENIVVLLNWPLLLRQKD